MYDEDNKQELTTNFVMRDAEPEHSQPEKPQQPQQDAPRQDASQQNWYEQKQHQQNQYQQSQYSKISMSRVHISNPEAIRVTSTTRFLRSQRKKRKRNIRWQGKLQELRRQHCYLARLQAEPWWASIW